jgi:hypothetical protein
MMLAGINYIDSITVWGVDGVNSERLSNFYILMTNSPFVTLDLQVNISLLFLHCFVV